MAPTNTPFDAEPIPTGVLDHLAARGREMRACTATTLSVVRYRDPVIRPSIDSMIFRNDFEKKATSTDNTNHPRGTVQLHFFYGCGIQRCEIRRSLEIKRSAIAGSRVFHSRPLLSLSFSVSFSVAPQVGIVVFQSISSHRTTGRSWNIDFLFLIPLSLRDLNRLQS